MCDKIVDKLDKMIETTELILLKQRLADAELALSKAVKAAEFFSSHADCRTDRWGCRCGFCRDTESSKNLREAREYMSKHKEGKNE